MSRECKHQIKKEEVDFIYRVLITIKRVWYLYIPDIILLVWILSPPFSMEKLRYFIIAILILGFRDISIIKQSQYYLESLRLEENRAFIQIVKYGKLETRVEQDIHTLSVQLYKKFCCSYLDIYRGRDLLHRQYAVGSYTFQKLHYLAEKIKQCKKRNRSTNGESG